jgi:hypothetical protein
MAALTAARLSPSIWAMVTWSISMRPPGSLWALQLQQHAVGRGQQIEIDDDGPVPECVPDVCPPEQVCLLGLHRRQDGTDPALTALVAAACGHLPVQLDDFAMGAFHSPGLDHRGKVLRR